MEENKDINWPDQLNQDASDDEDICDCSCLWKERLQAWVRKKLNQQVHPLTLQVKDIKMREKFLNFSRERMHNNLKLINTILLVSTALYFISALTDLSKKGVILLFHLDLPLIGLLVQGLGPKKPWLYDIAPLMVLIVHTGTISLLHCSYHFQWFELEEIDRS